MSDQATLPRLFLAQAAARGDAAAMRSKKNGAWLPVSWREWERRARCAAARLVEAGVEPGDRVAIFGNTREEWMVADLAGLMAGAATVPIYPSLVGEQAAYILADSGARVLIAEDASFVQRVAAHDAGVVERLTRTWLFGEMPQGDPPPDLARQVDERIAAAAPSDLATLVYTSGTTGPPKGAMLTHGNIVSEVSALDGLLPLGPDDEQLLFLPLAHIFGRVLVAMQYEVGYSTAIAESLLKALDNAAEVNPTFMGCVPRLYEKVYAVANEKAASAGGTKERLFRWATEAGKRKAGGVGGWVADKLVLSKIRARFGTRLKFAISGGAPLAKDLAEWFEGAGLLVLEAYGLTETTGGTTINTIAKHRFGTVGPPVPGVEVRIANDGEILVRGPTVMRGYWNREPETREVIDAEGWFHSGDIGEFDADGCLRITDRKKDIIVTAGGKNVAPQNVENLLKQSGWISQAMVHGDRRPYLVALVTLNAETASRFARDHGKPDDVTKLADDAEVRAAVEREIAAVNGRLSSFESVKRFAILPKDFTIDGGELTPTLKVKRKVVSERYRATIDGLYDER
ncbi:MAG TPA: AMP-dependent synthetase/ligase [Polyangiaceae bacterium]|jgi:long-chain acyl-CoA synthetase